MSLDKDTVAKIARLSRINVTEEEKERLAGELNQILEWVEQLGEVQTDGVEPMTSVVAQNLRMREDAVTEGDCRDDVLKNAPESAEGFYVVPKVVE